jgi:hypothetical protein
MNQTTAEPFDGLGKKTDSMLIGYQTCFRCGQGPGRVAIFTGNVRSNPAHQFRRYDSSHHGVLVCLFSFLGLAALGPDFAVVALIELVEVLSESAVAQRTFTAGRLPTLTLLGLGLVIVIFIRLGLLAERLDLGFS